MEITIIKNLSLAYFGTFALKCAADLDIAGHIQAYGRAIPLNDLARSIPIPPGKDSMLGRLMALLVHQGVFVQSKEGYLLTPVSELMLIKGSNMNAYARSTTSLVEITKSLGCLSEVFTDSGTSTLCEKAFDGKQFWEVLKERPDTGKANYYTLY